MFLSILAAIFIALATVNVGMSKSKSGLFSLSSISSIEALAQSEGGGQASCRCDKPCKDGETIASCVGYQECYCNSGGTFVECDGIKSWCEKP
jgi:hypothetical protein